MLLLAVSELGNDILEEFISIFISNYHPVQKYLIQFSKEFEKSINKCDKTIKGRVLEGIIHLEKSPLFEIGDTIKPLKNDAKKRWRYRFGDYRLVYFPDEGRRIVILLDFGPRKDIYRE